MPPCGPPRNSSGPRSSPRRVPGADPPLPSDDAPNPPWPPRLLDLLARRNVRATFFLVGSRAQAEPSLVRQIAAAGHLIGNHSWSHLNLALASSASLEGRFTAAYRLSSLLPDRPAL